MAGPVTTSKNFFASLFDDSRLVTILVPEWAGPVICWPEWRLMLTRQECFALCSLCRTVRTLPKKGRVRLLRKTLPFPSAHHQSDFGLWIVFVPTTLHLPSLGINIRIQKLLHTSISFRQSMSAQHVSEANLRRDASESMLDSVRTCESSWICCKYVMLTLPF